MVIHQCEKCDGIFTKKSSLQDHLNKKNPCKPKKNEKNKCPHCRKYYSRKDSLNRHIKSIHANILIENKNININNINNNNNNGNINITNNNNNNIINQYVLLPFGKYGTDHFTTAANMVALFTSEMNIIETYVVKTHLDPDKKQYHNCGITDIQSGYGIIYNSEGKWLYIRINDIMNTLIDLGQEGSLKIYNEIKDFLLDDVKKSIERDLNNNNHILRPRSGCYDFDIKSKKNLIAHLKADFFNNRHLVMESIRKTKGKPIYPNKKQTNNILKEGITVENIDKLIKDKKHNENKINLKKEIANDVLGRLTKIDDDQRELLSDMINNMVKINDLNIVIRLLGLSLCFSHEINEKIIHAKIKKEAEMDKLLFG